MPNTLVEMHRDGLSIRVSRAEMTPNPQTPIRWEVHVELVHDGLTSMAAAIRRTPKEVQERGLTLARELYRERGLAPHTCLYHPQWKTRREGSHSEAASV